MCKGICYGLLSAAAGIGLSFFNQGMGVVIAISIIGAGIIAELDKREK